MQYTATTPRHDNFATASDHLDIVRKHVLAKEKLLDFYGMLDQQQTAVLEAQSAHQSSYADYLEHGDALNFEKRNDHYGFLLKSFDRFLKDFSAALDEHAAAQYLYLSVFPLGHPDSLVDLETESASLIADPQVPDNTLALTGISEASPHPAAPVI